jgi:hypothetical protein
MAKRSTGVRPDHGKLLDAWMPPDDAGEPVGCITTSFTFQPEHFEDECLRRFLRIESDPDEDGPLYVIEFEEKASQIACAAALVDQHHCRGHRSLRWDLLPVRPPIGSIQHAKVSLLYWSNHIRVIVSSSNLTQDGYRRNREVFGVLNYRPGTDSPRTCLIAILSFLDDIVGYSGDATSPGVLRCRGLLNRVSKLTSKWSSDSDFGDRAILHAVPILTGPGRSSAYEQLQSSWPSRAPLHSAWVVSPFYDPSGAVNVAASALWNLIAGGGRAWSTT